MDDYEHLVLFGHLDRESKIFITPSLLTSLLQKILYNCSFPIIICSSFLTIGPTPIVTSDNEFLFLHLFLMINLWIMMYGYSAKNDY